MGLSLSQCFSGAFQSLSEIDGVCVMSASSPGESSWAEPDHAPFNFYLAHAIQKLATPSLDSVYDHVTRKDWHAQWNELSSQKALKNWGGISDYARDEFTVDALGNGRWVELRKTFATAEDYVPIVLGLADLLKQKKLAYAEFKSRYVEQVDTDFQKLPDDARPSWIRDCHSAWMHIVSIEQDAAGRRWGLDANPNVPDDQKEEIAREFNRALTDESRKFRGTCRRALRIAEQEELKPIRARFDSLPDVEQATKNRVNACRHFEF